MHGAEDTAHAALTVILPLSLVTDNVPAVFVAIVNYRTAPMVVECLARSRRRSRSCAAGE